MLSQESYENLEGFVLRAAISAGQALTLSLQAELRVAPDPIFRMACASALHFACRQTAELDAWCESVGIETADRVRENAGPEDLFRHIGSIETTVMLAHM